MITNCPMQLEQSQQQMVFPKKHIVGLRFKDIKQLRAQINNEARSRNQPQKTSWFHVSSQDQNYTNLKCEVSPTCPAFIKLLYVKDYGFTVDSVISKHNHAKNTIIQQLMNHHIISPYVKSFTASKTKKMVTDGIYRVRTNCCLKNNPGETAIAYSASNDKGELILENSFKFSDFTNNKAQFTVLMYALLDCFEHGITRIQINSRSKLVVDFMNGISKISAHNLRQISQAAKLLASRLGGQINYVVMNRAESSVKLQNICRKLLDLQQVD